MLSIRKMALIYILVLIPLSMVTSTVYAEKRKENRAVFRGQVVHISNKFITVERTYIVLPPTTRTLDINGSSIPFGTIKKGDYVIVTIEKNEATIQMTVRSHTDGDEKLIPQ
ncbi:MAG: hypothetical protein FJ110_12245 [Deltaproteobacteria bacterium]|nr:hypothetical protein [Deltaproteobacteria bacterium]